MNRTGSVAETMTRPKILVVEDEADILDVLEYALLREGFRVLSTQNGEEGIRLARQEAPELVLLDLMLPGVDGIEVCQKLKRDAVTRDTPIIIVTAKGEESDIVLGLGVGAERSENRVTGSVFANAEPGVSIEQLLTQ